VTLGTQISALLRKELIDISRNRAALVPVMLVSLLALVLPFAIVIGIPAVTGSALGEDADLVKISTAGGGVPAAGLTPEGSVQLFLFQQFLLMFLLMPITGTMALAAHSVIGEKEARTLEPLLAAPIGTFDLLLAKGLGALIPTLGISFTGLFIYFAGILWLAEDGVLPAMLNGRTALLVLWVGPAAALVSLQAALIISSRVNDPRTAQQFSVLIILPVTGVLIAQFTGSLALDARMLGLVGAALLGFWVLLAAISVALFRRETILTRWR
jgi:ABC-2 type transport system permease protein